MLSRRAKRSVVWLLVLGFAASAWGQDDELDSGLRPPVRLTVGVGDQFLGQLQADGKTLVFASNRNTATEIYTLDVESGREHLLFDEGADVTWPRVSPDGKTLLYVSFRERASGELCVRDLPSAENRRCLDSDTSALQAEWIDSRRVALVSRASIQDDLRLLEVRVGPKLEARPLLARNLTSPAISPDGKWLVYVPIERSAQQVGPGFAARASTHLEALRLDRPSEAAMPLTLDLPGQTGQPVFSRDGKNLYVVQFFTDSNRDGVIDASDRGVLFRVPFPTERDDAPAVAAAAIPDQLTDESWNCEYPAPAPGTLITTCSRDQSLDVYELPLDGEVPETWDAARINEELTLAGSRVEQLLLYRQRLLRETRPKAQRILMMRLAQVHLLFEDFNAAEFYAKKMETVDEPATAGTALPLQVLIDHRRAMKDRERGRMIDDFRAAERQRLAQLDASKAPSPAAAALTHLVRSELFETAADMKQARSELEAGAPSSGLPRAVLDAYALRADAFYRAVDDRDALVEAEKQLSLNKTYNADDQLEHARAAVRALYRGRPYAEADAAMAKAFAEAPPDSEYAFALALGRCVNALHEEKPPHPIRDALLALYHAQTRPGRRRAVVEDGVARASQFGADGVMEQLALAYVEDVPPGNEEHRRAERLYRRALTGRAYRRRAKNRLDDARNDFDAVTQRTGSLETAVEAINLRLKAGEAPEQIEKEVTTREKSKAVPLAHFVKAYVTARQLPKLEADAHAKAVTAAVSELKASWPELKDQRAVQALYGAILHEDFLRSGDLSTAEKANKHYLVALDLVRNNIRYKAMILGALGVLHTQVGNFHIALGYLDAREKLPYVENGAVLAVKLARARALLHVGREAEAAQVADQAVAMVDTTPKLAPFLPLALDRAALDNLAAGKFERALALYDRELPLVDAGTSDAAAIRNRLVVRLGLCAAALGANQPQHALDVLARVDHDLAAPEVLATLSWPHATPEQVHRAYRLIAAGLRANAESKLGQLADAQRALEARRQLFLDRLHESDADEDVREVTLAETRLAVNSYDQHQMAQAARWLDEALGHADNLVDRTHAPVEPGQLDVLWFSAELGAKQSFDLSKRLDEAQRELAAQKAPAWRTYQAWFEIYSALGGKPGTPPTMEPAAQR